MAVSAPKSSLLIVSRLSSATVKLNCEPAADTCAHEQRHGTTSLCSLLVYHVLNVLSVQMGNGYVDVTTRIVDFPSDAGTLASIWHNIASQLVVNNTLLPALNSLLSALSAPLYSYPPRS